MTVLTAPKYGESTRETLKQQTRPKRSTHTAELFQPAESENDLSKWDVRFCDSRLRPRGVVECPRHGLESSRDAYLRLKRDGLSTRLVNADHYGRLVFYQSILCGYKLAAADNHDDAIKNNRCQISIWMTKSIDAKVNAPVDDAKFAATGDAVGRLN